MYPIAVSSGVEVTMSVSTFPPSVTIELPGWELVWARIGTTGATADLEAAWANATEALGKRLAGGPLAEVEPVPAIRRLFREAGTDPTRYRPSSEALARRVLKGSLPPAIHPLVDFNNLLSVHLLLPCCVIEPSAVEPPFTLRRGRPGESMESMRGPFSLEGRPVLEDRLGPFGTPITDSERVRILPEAREAWLVVYGLPGGRPAVSTTLHELAARFPAVEVLQGSS